MITHSERLNKVRRVFDPYNDRKGYVRLDRNEDPIGYGDAFFNNWKSQITIDDIAAYADSTAFTQELSKWVGVLPENVYIGAGSDALIKAIFETYIDQGDTILLQNPSWRMYNVYASIYGAEINWINYSDDFFFDTDALIQTLQAKNIRMVILANPNQPTGTSISYEILKKIISAAKERNTLVVVDEAYYLFHDVTVVDLISDFDNLIIARTFSKAFGLAGLRIGYAVAHSRRIQDFMLLRPVTDANSLAINFASYLLGNIDYVIDRIKDFNRGRDFLFEKMRENNLVCQKSYGNFLLLACIDEEKARSLIAYAREKKYLLKGPFLEPPLKNYIRISTSSLELMKSFWDDCCYAMKNFAKKYGLEK